MMVARFGSGLVGCCVLALVATVFTVASPSVSRGGTFDVANETELTDLMIRIRARQFLQRATFGPTEAEIDAMVTRMKSVGVLRAGRDWIDEQFALPASSHSALSKSMVQGDGFADNEADIGIARYRDYAWSQIAIAGQDQLRQRVAWALSQIVVTSNEGANFNNNPRSPQGHPYWLGPANYYDILVENADDTYRELLGDVTYHPIMGVYLSHVRNKKASGDTYPDENYAREIQQLFSIGLYKLTPDGRALLDAQGTPIPTYDNTTIQNFARLFTGLTYFGNTSISFGPLEYNLPMIMLNSSHDTASKVLLNGYTLPANTDGVADINAGLNHLYSHANVAPFISRLLIQRLVRSNPSRGYIERVAKVFNNNGSGVKGHLPSVIKAILLDREAWDSIQMRRMRSGSTLRLQVVGAGTESSRMVEPVLLYTSFLRYYSTASTHPTGQYRMPANEGDFDQGPYRAPSVFNFYLPDFQPAGPLADYKPSRKIPAGELYAPEFQLLTSVIANRLANRFRTDIYRQYGRYSYNSAKTGSTTWDFNFDFSDEVAVAGSAANLARHLDLTICNGTMTEAERTLLTTRLGTSTTNLTDRAEGAILSTWMSPACMIAQ